MVVGVGGTQVMMVSVGLVGVSDKKGEAEMIIIYRVGESEV